MSEYLELYDYRNRNSALYRERREALAVGDDAQVVLRRFREGKDALFAHHPQSPLDDMQRRSFQGLRYFPYNPAMRFAVTIEPANERILQQVTMSAHDVMNMITVGYVHFVVDATQVTLSIYWLEIYSGGLFLPFRDTTSPAESYGGGRYLFDTIKGSDPLPVPGSSDWHTITLDFNYAYNPSCAYNSRWVCPLAPTENRLSVAIRAGEMAASRISP